MPFALAYDQPDNILLIRFSGAMTAADHRGMVAAAHAFIQRNGPCHAITDLGAVAAFDIPLEYIKSFARTPSVLSRQKRVIVAPTDEIFGTMRLFELYQSATGEVPLVVRTLPEAYAHLGLVAPDFQPLN